MTALKAYKRHFGIEPTDAQVRMATHEYYGGNTDPQTIASIPDQAEALAVLFFLSEGVIPTARDVAGDIDFRKWGTWRGRNGRAWPGAEKGKWSRAPADVADWEMELAVVIKWWLYTNTLERVPDEEGTEGGDYWVNRITETLRALSRNFADGVTDAADLERLEAVRQRGMESKVG